MAFNCEFCGFRTNEVKAGGAIPPMGERIVLKVTSDQQPDVLDRDVLKSDSASVNIPEIELEMQPGSLGGLYTTIEGLLEKVGAFICRFLLKRISFNRITLIDQS